MKASGQQALLIVASVVVVVAGLRAVEPILAPILLAAFVALAIAPAERWLTLRGLPVWAAKLAVMLATLGVLALLTVIVANSVSTFHGRLGSYEASFRHQISSVVDGVGGFLEAQLELDLDELERDAKASLDPATLFAWARKVAAASGGIASNMLFVIVLTVFMSFESLILPKKLRAIQHDADAPRSTLRRFVTSVTGYVRVKTMTSAATGVLVGIACAALGVDFAALWGLLAFGLNFVPSIGSILAALPAVALAFVLGGTDDALLLAACYLATNFVVGTIVEPRLMGQTVGMSTLVIVLSLVFWGWVLGPVGMLLAVPLTMAVKLALDQSADLHWIGILLGADPEDDPGNGGADEDESPAARDAPAA